jgi:hypothetical protein
MTDFYLDSQIGSRLGFNDSRVFLNGGPIIDVTLRRFATEH